MKQLKVNAGVSREGNPRGKNGSCKGEKRILQGGKADPGIPQGGKADPGIPQGGKSKSRDPFFLP